METLSVAVLFRVIAFAQNQGVRSGRGRRLGATAQVFSDSPYKDPQLYAMGKP